MKSLAWTISELNKVLSVVIEVNPIAVQGTLSANSVGGEGYSSCFTSEGLFSDVEILLSCLGFFLQLKILLHVEFS